MIHPRHIDPRRMQERRDSHLIEFGSTDFASCPRQAVHHEWPKMYYDPHIVDQGIGENRGQKN